MTSGAPVVAGLGGVLLFLAAGLGLVELLPALRERPLAARLGWAYLLGVAVVAGSMYLMGIAFDVRIRRGVVLASVVLLVVSGLVARILRRRQAAPPASFLYAPRAGVLAARFAFGASAFIATGLLAAALTQPNVGWDGEMSWCAAARWIRADRSITPRAFVDPRVFVSHPRYPILMPLAQVAVQETFDVGDDRRAVKPLYAAFFPALLLVLFDLSRRHAGTCAAALAVTAFAAVPFLVFSDFGGADGTFSDVPLGAFLGGGFLLLLGRVHWSEAAAAAILLGAAVLTKNEGLPFAFAALAAVAFQSLFERALRRRTRLAALGLAAAAVFAAGLALRVWQSHIPQRWDEDYVGRLGEVSLAAEARARLPLVPAAILKEMGNPQHLAGFGIAGAIILTAGVGGLRRRIVSPIVLCVYFCFGAYVLALLLTTWPGVEQVHPTWYRFLMQVSLPLGVLVALALREAWRARLAWMRPATTRAPAQPAHVGTSQVAPRAALVFLGFALSPVLLVLLLALNKRGRKSSVTSPVAARAVAPAPTASPWREDALLTGGVDEPSEGASVRGRLAVRGWARLPGRDLEVTALVDGRERIPLGLRRFGRPDVQRVLPALGDCASAGYELMYPYSADDAGPHELQVIFRTKDGRERHYPARRFVWNP